MFGVEGHTEGSWYPLKLTQGDIGDRLDELQTVDSALLDPTASNVKALDQIGFSRAQSREALEFVRDEIPTSTDLVEQGHGSGA